MSTIHKDSVIHNIAVKYNITYTGYTYNYKHMIFTGEKDDIYNFAEELKTVYISYNNIFHSSYTDDDNNIYNKIPVYAIWV